MRILSSISTLWGLTSVHRPPRLGGREPSTLGLEGVNFVRGLSESDTPQAAMEIPCAWHVVTQKRETVLFGAEDKGGWSLGADACRGGAGQGITHKETRPTAPSRPMAPSRLWKKRRELRAARPGLVVQRLCRGPWWAGRNSAKSRAKKGTQATGTPKLRHGV